MLLECREKNNYNLLYGLTSPYLVQYNCLDELAEWPSYRMLFLFAAELDPVQVADLKEVGEKSIYRTMVYITEEPWGRYQIKQLSTVRERMVSWLCQLRLV